MRDDSRKENDGEWLFLEEGGVVAGALCYVELKRTLDPLPERDSLPGENAFEAEKLDSSSFKHEMVAKYNKVLFQTDFLGKGAAKFMMRFIIDEAKKQELNVAAAVVADEVEWYRAWGFQEVHPVRMLLNGTVPATNQMVLELFPVAASCCVQ
ncbi:hypothetical protein QFC24_005736 [Naganishia onofrii]|uniref:Uncharacterized protein n=1 Tax=Naganishia onofrii TaxID=1851511 RepID=A0ACC2X7A8_9TREE|nr:hypothetical protein QFC24_005736 [Naganishia onofrii]